MVREEAPIVDRAAPFDVSELFFSTTDRKGHITSCNEVFLRVAGFAPGELLGAPHNVIRHPHMPRCVFNLLWEYLLDGRSIGAYVKNRAKNGEYYWVFALASPSADGFLSVRVKPGSPLFAAVAPLYRRLLDHERTFGADWRAGMESSRQMLVAALGELGFSSYDAFMNHALRQELLWREEAMAAASTLTRLRSERPIDVALQSLSRLDELQAQLEQREAFLRSLGVLVSRVAVNAAVKAAHLGDSEDGAALGTISAEVSRIAKQITEESQRLGEESVRLRAAAFGTTVGIASTKLYQEMLDAFADERRAIDLDPAAQLARFGVTLAEAERELAAAIEHSHTLSATTLEQLRVSLRAFRVITESLARILLTIQFSYVTGKMLAARLADGNHFGVLLSELAALSDGAREQLSDLKAIVDRVARDVASFSRGVRDGADLSPLARAA
jgi:PAS domain S-box-containing protein